MRIERLSWATIRSAARLGNRVFPDESPSPGVSFWGSLLLPNPVLKLAGYRDIRYWVAVPGGHAGPVLGTIGLYSTAKDRFEARWLGWFCVAPDQRGRGLGGQLLDRAIAEALREGARLLRVETWDGPEATDANNLYERRGLKITKLMPVHGEYIKIYRETVLS